MTVRRRRRRPGIRHRRRRRCRRSHCRGRRSARRQARTRQRRPAWVRARATRCAVRRQSRSAGVRTRGAHGVAAGWTSLRPDGQRKRKRGGQRHTGQKMMFHVCDPLSSVLCLDMVGRLGWLAFGRSPLLYPLTWYSQRFVESPAPSSATRPRPLLSEAAPASVTQPVINDKACRPDPYQAICPPHTPLGWPHIILGSSSWQAQQ